VLSTTVRGTAHSTVCSLTFSFTGTVNSRLIRWLTVRGNSFITFSRLICRGSRGMTLSRTLTVWSAMSSAAELSVICRSSPELSVQ